MELNKMTKEELETLSYTDIAFKLLKESNSTMNTPTIFRKICDLLEFTDNDYENNIGDFYTSLTTDQRFILLDDASWDLRDNHSIKIAFDDDDDEDEEMENEEELEEIDDTEEETDDVEEAIDDEDIPDDDDDMDDLSIVEEDEELEEN